ncbi:MAG TPA: tripartite tricarboxylate transporter substrate binding protein [Alphaproteobacteria bacterium]
MMRARMLMAATAVAAIAAAAAPQAVAEEYPQREITAICPFGPGTGADIFIRFFADRLSKLSGQPVVVVNRPGAGGSLASSAVAKAKPDGYTLAITPASSTVVTASHLFKEPPFHPLKDFEPVTTLASVPFVLVVAPNHPAKTVAELTDILKKKGATANYGGSANTGIVASELYKKAEGLEVARVSYKSVVDILRDMQGGQIDFTFTDASWAKGQAAEGRLRPLAVTSAKRSSALPDVPTMKEAGVDGVQMTPWWAVLAPAGTPKPIVEKLSGWFNQILAMDDTKAFLANIATEPMPGDPESLRKLMAEEYERWAEYVRLANIPKQ